MKNRFDRYDHEQPFDVNKAEGPFGDNVDWNEKIKKALGEFGIETDFFGYKTKLPLGVAAGPLCSPEHMKKAAADGFDVITWKTFRTVETPAHTNEGSFLGHNIVRVMIDNQLRPEDMDSQYLGSNDFSVPRDKITITNSFGMPSDTPDIWGPEVTHIEDLFNANGKLAIASVVGTPSPNATVRELAENYARCALYAEQAGAKIIEANWSCPNVAGKEGAIFQNPEDATLIAKTIRSKLGPSTKVLYKIGYDTKANLKRLIQSTRRYADGYTAINAISMSIIDQNGRQAVPGGLKSGTCGYAALDMAVEAVGHIADIRKELEADYKIIGVGGITNPEAAMKHLKAGADFLECATANIMRDEEPITYKLAKYIRKNRINLKL